jgi:hypothetical protein
MTTDTVIVHRNAPIPPAEEPEFPKTGNLSGREVAPLKKDLLPLGVACAKKQIIKDTRAQSMVDIASLIVGVSTVILSTIFLGTFLGGVLIAIRTSYLASCVFALITDKCKDNSYGEAVQALGTQPFIDFLNEKKLSPTIDSIVATHNLFKKFQAEQLKQVEAN